MKYRFEWTQIEPTYWWSIIAGYTLHVYQPDTPDTAANHWIGEIISYDSKVVDRIKSDYPTAEETREQVELALLRFLKQDALKVGAAHVAMLIEKKWGVSTNNFIPLTFASLLTGKWSEMYIPNVARCFVAESRLQWYWITVMDNGQQVSGTAQTLHEAKRDSVIAAQSQYIVSLVRTDFDTLESERYLAHQNAELQKVQN